MLPAFLQETFDRLRGNTHTWSGEPTASSHCVKSIDEIAEFVIAQTSSRLRVVPGSVRRLRGPIADTMRYIDELVEQVPGVVRCERAAFSEDPRVNAFFVDHRHLQQVFSQSSEVRALFDEHPSLQECFGLLCMRKEERRQLGMALMDDAVHKDVLQTSVNFTDHQIVSPGSDEADARCALKCCIFKSLIDHIRRQAMQAETGAYELENRHRALRARLRRLTPDPSSEGEREDLERQLQVTEEQLQSHGPRLASLEDHLRFVIDVLANPEQMLRAHQRSIFVDRMGIMLDQPDAGASELNLSEIQIGRQHPRVACLVGFRRAELLPRRDFLQEASVFLTA
jgi:hypothetical protein